MPRWEPDSRARLAEAAMALYHERGFDRTTVAEIAERAGLTERTFFRLYTDKREVLFAGASGLEETLVAAVADAPESASPLDAVAAGLEAVGDYLPDRELSRRRQAVIDANAELQERELIKLASLTTALAEALRRRGVDDAAASLTAEIGISIFRVAFERWLGAPEDHGLAPHVADAIDRLKVVAGGA